MKQLTAMRQHIGDCPVVIVHNYLESFRKFLSRTGDENILLDRRFNGDQALFWLGDDKLVITSAPIANAELLCERWGYTNIKTLSPEKMTASISKDIIREETLLQAILTQAGEAKKAALVPYASTPEFLQLAETLRTEYGLEVLLPECPSPEHLWIKDYIDSKVGFRTLFSQWAQGSEIHKYPQGFMCDNLTDVAHMIDWFREKGKGCVIKASQGGSGVGNLFMPFEEIPPTIEEILDHLHSNIYLKQDLYIVEEYILSPTKESPSAEFYCPPAGTGQPQLTYICDQHFEASGRFAGVVIGAEIEHEAWYPNYVRTAKMMAEKIQQMGYVGNFDIDSIVDDSNHAYMLEINSRRTGGTYAHEFMEHVFGAEYYNRIAVLAHNKTQSSSIQTLEELETAIGDLLYPINGEDRGVIVLLTSTLSKGKFGYLILGDSLEETKEIRRQMTERIQHD